MSIEVRDSHFLDLVADDLELETLADGFRFTEGPIWHPRDAHLTFSDIPSNRLHRWSEADGLSVHREPSELTNGNAYDLEGRILSCEHATARVTREEPDGSRTVLASHFESRELNSPNDIVVRANGDVYFTDPTYGRGSHTGIVRDPELDFQGVYRIDAVSGDLVLLAKDFEQPNGLAFTVDQSELYIADTPRMHIRKFQVAADGTLSGGEVFAESTGEGAGAPDGLKVASTGHVFCAGPGGVHAYAPEDGTCLGVIQTPAFCANFTWGGDDMKTFFLTSSNHLYRTQLKVSGNPLF
ncbi:MAG: SMP-30/gluconolactonase/LRE family protein [Acidobacteriota bacterium]|nr:SMP-30/gluconolactonase/LRE family protein [Acidobacteriota bacterium]